MAASGNIVWKEGIAVEGCLQEEPFFLGNTFFNELVKIGGLEEFNRAGIRFLYSGHSSFSKDIDIRAHVGERILSAAARTLGKPEDFATTIEGKDADDLNYRWAFGPLLRTNVTTMLGEEASDATWVRHALYSTAFDLDLYETEFRQVSGLYRWAQTKLEKVVKLNKSLNLRTLV